MIFLRAAVLSMLVDVTLARSYSKRQVADNERDSPLFVKRSNYLGRKLSSSIVVGNYLYVDGGEILYKNENDTVFTDAKSTYSIDVSSSWTNATVVIKQIDKAIDGRAFDYPKLWPTFDNSSFYSYNGDKGWFYTPANPPSNKLYKFISDGSGDGQWFEDDQSYTAGSNFTNLARVGGSASACGPDTCYAVGGWRNSRTDNALDHDIPAAGIVSYNLTSHQWYNDSLVGSVFQGPWRDGHLFFTDIAGSEGALIAIGGSVSNLAGGNFIQLSFGYVYLYDIATKSWYQQGTGGDVPSLPKAEYCTVGLQGDNPVNKTYEIFVYGSCSNDSSRNDVDVWVLSIPSFQWHQAGQSDRFRFAHSCNVAGHRQMIVVGGLGPDGFSGKTGDTWPLGLGVFDLSEMMFKDRYDADASVYTSPEVVKRWHAKNGSMAKNISEDVESLFDRSTDTDPSASSSTDTRSSSASSVPTSTDTRSSSGSDSSGSVSAGAIAGGVVGGVVLLAVVAAGVWTCIRRRRRRRRQIIMPNIPQPVESDSQARVEVDGQQTHEKEAQQTYEIEAQQRHELH